MKSKTSTTNRYKCRGKIAARSKNGHFEAQDPAAVRKHWENRLTRMGLSMEAGRVYDSDGKDVIVYGHRLADLDWDGRMTYMPPKGERLEDEGWSISLV